MLADAARLPVAVDEELGENDRSATGFLPPAEFESVGRRVLRPARRQRARVGAGRGRAAPHRRRGRRVAAAATGDVAVVAHGGVGALLLCSLARGADRPACGQPGQGSWYRFDATTREAAHGWRRLDGAPAGTTLDR